MNEDQSDDRSHLPRAERWALWRFSIVGPLFAATPTSGELRAAIRAVGRKDLAPSDHRQAHALRLLHHRTWIIVRACRARQFG